MHINISIHTKIVNIGTIIIRMIITYVYIVRPSYDHSPTCKTLQIKKNLLASVIPSGVMHRTNAYVHSVFVSRHQKKISYTYRKQTTLQ